MPYCEVNNCGKFVSTEDALTYTDSHGHELVMCRTCPYWNMYSCAACTNYTSEPWKTIQHNGKKTFICPKCAPNRKCAVAPLIKKIKTRERDVAASRARKEDNKRRLMALMRQEGFTEQDITRATTRSRGASITSLKELISVLLNDENYYHGGF